MYYVPGYNPNIIIASSENYGCGSSTHLLLSVSNGYGWQDITDRLGGLPSSTRKIDVAVASDGTNGRIYVAACYGTDGYNVRIYMSSDQGSTFELKGDHQNGSMALANDLVINPLDIDEIFIGGFGQASDKPAVRSFTNQGSTKNSGKPAEYIHGDTRDIEIFKKDDNTFILYAGTDGGLWSVEDNSFTNTTSAWIDLNGTTLHISEYYGMDIIESNGMIGAGAQDLAFYYKSNNTWINSSIMGDAYESVTNPYDESIWTHGYIQDFYRYTKAGWQGYFNNYPEQPAGRFFYEMAFDNDRFYIGSDSKACLHSLESSNPSISNRINMLDQTVLSKNEVDQNGNPVYDRQHISAMAIAPSNHDTVYIAFNKGMLGASNPEFRMYRSSNARSANSTTPATWFDISNATNPTEKLTGYQWCGVKEIVVDPKNAARIWVCFNGFFDGNKVFFSNNAGTTWTNVSTGILNFPVNCMVYQQGTTDAIYIGTDVGVYFNPNASDPESEWLCYSGELPVAVVTNLRIDYCRSKIIASTFGHGIWEADLATNANLPLFISSNKTWDYPKTIVQDIIITSGNTLTITSKIKFAEYKKIFINPGAKLIANGATLTNLCTGKLWNGIVVLGNSNAPQNSTYQGVVELINGTIVENAITGVRAIGWISGTSKPNPLTSKGIIKASNSTFRNNQKDVEIWGRTSSPTGQSVNNKSCFRMCTFTTTEANFGNSLREHINLTWCNGILIEGCTFSDQRTNVNPKFSGRTGINSSEASFICQDYLNVLTNTFYKPKFLNLGKAVHSVSGMSDSRTFITQCSTSSYKGFYLLRAPNPRVVDNTFTIKDEEYAVGDVEYPYGLYLDETTVFDIEYNTYNGIKTISHRTGGHGGLIVRNSGANTTRFYRNNFSNITIASEALNDNRDVDKFERGLTFRCNDYQDNIKDLQVLRESTSSLSGLSGMAENQGSLTLTADNLFGDNLPPLNLNMDNHLNKLNYFHPNPILIPRSKPIGVYKVSLTEVNTSTRRCPNELAKNGVGWISAARGDLLPYKGTMEALNTSWFALIDLGNTPYNIAEAIENATLATASGVYSTLMSISPWLSLKALTALAAKENAFTDLQIRNLLQTNPHAGRSDYILEILANRNTPFPPTYLDRIIESADSITSRDSLAWMVSDANRNYDLLLNDVVGWYFDDTLERISTLDSLLTHPYNPMYRYQLAALYFERGLYTNYQNVLDSIPAQIVLTDRELIWHQTFNDLYDQIKIWKQDSFPLPLLDSGQLVWMKEFYEEHPEMPGIGHALLSVNDTSYSHTDPVYINDTTAYTPPPSPFETNDISNIRKTNRLKVYPNPSDRKIHFEWLSSEPLPKGTLIRIYDQSGKKVGELNWYVSSKVLTIDLNYLPSGIYYASMLHGQKQIEIQRILLQR
ncbi:MAG: T9SS type A sorting domain-containing protein [Bacteroidia bacterium]|nr:T9SS type A sorting domain-containing protein [Bacteroidia bacterium]